MFLDLALALSHTLNDTRRSYILVKDRIIVHSYGDPDGTMLPPTSRSSVGRGMKGKRPIGATSRLGMFFVDVHPTVDGIRASR